MGFTETMKVYIFPLDRNLYTIRLENLNDKFDSPKVDIKTSPHIDLYKFVKEFYILSNNDPYLEEYIDEIDIEIIELTLSGN